MDRHILKKDGDSHFINPVWIHEYTIIFLHGLGDCSKSFVDIFMKDLDIFAEADGTKVLTPPNCRVVLHTAPKAATTCNNGQIMNSWFDFLKLQQCPKDKTLGDI
jgi:predicted esterase